MFVFSLCKKTLKVGLDDIFALLLPITPKRCLSSRVNDHVKPPHVIIHLFAELIVQIDTNIRYDKQCTLCTDCTSAVAVGIRVPKWKDTLDHCKNLDKSMMVYKGKISLM